ncbi:MAG: hypothetical protein WBF17_21970, partial [Phycisphaerae bacterium]
MWTKLLPAMLATMLAAAAPRAGDDAPVKQLIDLSRPDTVHFTAQDKAEAQVAAGANGGNVLNVTCPAGKGYPGAHVRPDAVGKGPKAAAWDLTGQAWIAARVHNPTDHGLQVLIRADNPGDWRKEPWNTQPSSVPAGETRDVKVWFGYSHGNKAFDIDRSNVVAVLVFLMNPKQDGAFHVEALFAGGKAGDRPPFWKRDPRYRPADGVLFSPSAAKDCKIEARGAEAKLLKVDGAGRLAVTIVPDGKEKTPGVAVAPTKAEAWDLGLCNHVDFRLANPGDRPLTVRCRLDNKGAGEGRKSVGEQVTLPPGATKAVRVPFVLPPIDLADKADRQGRFESDSIVCFRVFAEKSAEAGTVHV